jgi:quinol monooxygenase YgiN
MPVIVTAVFHPLDGHRSELVSALHATIPAVHDEDGCLLYAIHDAADGTITMIEKWTTPEALKAHADGPAVVALNAAVGPHLAAPTTVTTMTPLEVGQAGKGAL